MDCNLPGFSVHGIFQTRVLEWVAISFSRGFSRPRDRTRISSIADRRFTIWATREGPLPLINTIVTWFFFFSPLVKKITATKLKRIPCTYICIHSGCMCAKSLQSCLTLCNPMDGSCQAPLSMGFSRQEYWSGLPFSSPGDLPNPGIEPTSLRSPALGGGFFTTSVT